MDILGVLTVLAQATVRGLWELVRRPVLLSLTVIGFVGGGVVALIVSAGTGGWWQDFWLNVGVNMIFVGAVDLIVLGAIQKLLSEPRGEAPAVTLTPEELRRILEYRSDPGEPPV